MTDLRMTASAYSAFIQAPGLDKVDGMSAEHRALVHEYGLGVVVAFLQNGITKPETIRYLVITVRNAGREGNKTLYGPKTNRGNSVLAALDPWLLSQGVGFPTAHLIRLIRDKSYSILPTSPTDAMVQASMETISGGNVAISKRDKHFRRLQAALLAGDRALWDRK
jgi:hypothetical protein